MSEIKQIDTGKCRLLAVMVPEGATYFDMVNALKHPQLRTIHPEHGGWWYSEELPEGKYKLLGIATEIPESVWQTLLPVFVCAPLRNRYINFLDVYSDLLTSAVKSGTSFLQANEVYSINPLAFDPTGITTSEWAHNEANTGTWVLLKQI